MPVINYTIHNYCRGCEKKYPKENSWCTDADGCGRPLRKSTKQTKFKDDKPRM